MVTVGIYIYINGVARRIELFDDEKISINSSVQNASDISKVYTDFSQSFTVPANDHNNAIFSHWYENSIDGGFDARKRKKAYIELDTIPFRNGNIQLEKATIKNGVPENYTITFFGSLVSLKDTFKGLKLSELDFSQYSFNYNPTEVINRVSGMINSDVKFPLISSNRVWQTTGTTDNITTSAGAIGFEELFPALRVSKIFETIANNYNIKFEGNFLTDKRFTNAFLWLKNSEKFTDKNENLKINYQSQTGDAAFLGYNMNLTDDKLNFTQPPSNRRSRVRLTITTSNLNIPYDVLVYKNGSLIERIPAFNTSASSNVFTVLLVGSDSPDFNGDYEFYIQSSSPITFTSVMNVIWLTFNTTALTVNQSISQTTTSIISLNNYMPDIKVEDFFTGILKMFNLTCIGYEEDVYNIEQLEDWYSSGDIIDVTKHVISDDIEISKLESFKKINFNYSKSENLLNVGYLENNGFEYGDLKADIDADGGEYNVQLPFENLLFSKFTGQNLQVGYALKTDLKSYTPKPVILYDYGTLQTCNFFLKGGTSPQNITTYNAFGQDTLYDNINYSLNFGLEISSLLLEPINNSLYSEYYQAYLENIYSIKARKSSVKSLLPISLLTNIKLNNRLIIRDKRYIINNMKIDLTSGEVDFELINDFRDLPIGFATINAVDDTVSLVNDGLQNIFPLSNDSLGTLPTTITSINTTGFTGGTITILSDGLSLLFTPNGNLTTNQTITYTITDSLGASDTANIIITVKQPEVPLQLLSGGISFELESSQNGCDEAIESLVFFKIQDTSFSVLQIGDVVYNTNDESSPFQGVDSKKYAILISDADWTGSSSKYVVTISNNGVIQSILETCIII
jgi:hypothetical protein